MLAAGVNFQFFQHGASKRAAWQHAFDCDFQHSARVFCLHFVEGSAFQVGDVAGVAVVNFVVAFFAGNAQFVGIDDDDVVAGVNVGGVFRFVFAAQTQGDFAGKASQGFVCSINQIPIAR